MIQFTCSFRFESGETKQATASDEQLREDLVQKLIQQKMLGPTRQITELDPCSLPLRDLPPGNVASLFLMYVAFCRTSEGGGEPASKSTFYAAAKTWLKHCLRFRPRTEHSLCVTCSSLKAAIHAATDPHPNV